MEDHTKRKLIKYYRELEQIAMDPVHKAYAGLMLYRLERNLKLSFFKSSKPIYDPSKKKCTRTIPHAAKAYGVSESTIERNFRTIWFYKNLSIMDKTRTNIKRQCSKLSKNLWGW